MCDVVIELLMMLCRIGVSSSIVVVASFTVPVFVAVRSRTWMAHLKGPSFLSCRALELYRTGSLCLTRREVTAGVLWRTIK